MLIQLKICINELKIMFLELKICIKEVYKPNSRKYFWHNLSCELRRGRYKSCYDYKDIWRTRFLFSLGVLVMNFWGLRYKNYIRRSIYGGLDLPTIEQWLSHPFPWIRYMCRRDIKKCRFKSEKG